jgi:hypothetical protein
VHTIVVSRLVSSAAKVNKKIECAASLFDYFAVFVNRGGVRGGHGIASCRCVSYQNGERFVWKRNAFCIETPSILIQNARGKSHDVMIAIR